MKKIFIFIFLFGLAGCGFVVQNLDQGQEQGLQYGMSKEEVAAKLGQPQRIRKAMIRDKEYDVWEYESKQPQAETINSLGAGALKVFFLDGRLVQRDKDRVYGQPAYEYLETVDSAGTPKDVTASGQAPKDNL